MNVCCNKLGIILSSAIRTKFPNRSDRYTFLSFIIVGVGLVFYSFVHYSLKWYDSRLTPVIQVSTLQIDRFEPAFRICLDVDINGTAELSTMTVNKNPPADNNIYLEFNTNNDLENRAGGMLGVYNYLISLVGGLNLTEPAPEPLVYIHQSKFHIQIDVGQRKYDCSFINTRGELGLDRESVAREFSILTYQFYTIDNTTNQLSNLAPSVSVATFVPFTDPNLTDEDVQNIIFDKAWNDQLSYEQAQTLYIGAYFEMKMEKSIRISFEHGTKVQLSMFPIFQSIIISKDNILPNVRNQWFNGSKAIWYGSTTIGIKLKSFLIDKYEDQQLYDFSSWIADLGGIAGIVTTIFAVLFPQIGDSSHESRLNKLFRRDRDVMLTNNNDWSSTLEASKLSHLEHSNEPTVSNNVQSIYDIGSKSKSNNQSSLQMPTIS